MLAYIGLGSNLQNPRAQIENALTALSDSDGIELLIVSSLYESKPLLVLRQSFLGVPKELEEAARIDGCSRLGEWWNVMIPAARADLITLAMFVFICT